MIFVSHTDNYPVIVIVRCYVAVVQGRPKGVREEDVYVCEYRVDKTARLFSRITRPRFPVNTKSYCFDTFEQRLQPRRTLTVLHNHCYLSATIATPVWQILATTICRVV